MELFSESWPIVGRHVHIRARERLARTRLWAHLERVHHHHRQYSRCPLERKLVGSSEMYKKCPSDKTMSTQDRTKPDAGWRRSPGGGLNIGFLAPPRRKRGRETNEPLSIFKESLFINSTWLTREAHRHIPSTRAALSSSSQNRPMVSKAGVPSSRSPGPPVVEFFFSVRGGGDFSKTGAIRGLYLFRERWESSDSGGFGGLALAATALSFRDSTGVHTRI